MTVVKLAKDRDAKQANDLPPEIEALHDDVLVPGHIVKEWWRTLRHREPEIVTTTWLAERIGMSAEWWADACRDGSIPGAWQDSPGSPWYLPVAEARAHLLRVRNRQTRTREAGGKARGPYRRAS